MVIRGQVIYSGFDALPWDTKVHIYVRNASGSSGEVSGVIAEKTILTKGEQIPIEFGLVVPRSVIEKTRLYEICADITIQEQQVFVCNKPVRFRGVSWPKQVRLALRRIR